MYETGFSVSQSRGLIALGLFKDWDDIRNSPTQNTWGSVEPGDIKYKDVNGDGVINNNDRVAVGNTNRPSFVYGMGISANWKGLDASVHFKEPVNLFFLHQRCIGASFQPRNLGKCIYGCCQFKPLDFKRYFGRPGNRKSECRISET